MNKWYDDNNFWVQNSDKLFNAEHFSNAADEVEQLIRLQKMEKGEKVLDLCCGPGRHAIELARAGLNVTAVDITPSYIETAAGKAENEKLSAEFLVGDMRTFVKENYFDHAILMYTSLGYFEDNSQNQLVLNNIFNSLKQKGSLVIDVVGREILKPIFRERDEYIQDGITYIEERKVNSEWNWIENKWTTIVKGVKEEYRLSHWLYSAEDLTRMIKEAGFNSSTVCGSLKGLPYDDNAERLIAVAYK